MHLKGFWVDYRVMELLKTFGTCIEGIFLELSELRVHSKPFSAQIAFELLPIGQDNSISHHGHMSD